MEKIKGWFMDWVVKKFLGEKIGKVIARADGKRTWLGIALLSVLALCKFVLPIFVPVPVEVIQAIDSLMLIISGATGSFAGVKAQKLWVEIKKAGDEVIK